MRACVCLCVCNNTVCVYTQAPSGYQSPMKHMRTIAPCRRANSIILSIELSDVYVCVDLCEGREKEDKVDGTSCFGRSITRGQHTGRGAITSTVIGTDREVELTRDRANKLILRPMPRANCGRVSAH